LGRELNALGHRVKLMTPGCVTAYVKRNKNDAADAEGICEAVTRPSMRLVPVKPAEPSVLMPDCCAATSPSPSSFLYSHTCAWQTARGGMCQRGRRRTIQDLMRHTAGLSYGYRGDGPAHQANVADGFLDESVQCLVRQPTRSVAALRRRCEHPVEAGVG
jgi:hypothetical protein